jgi:hypothetical protein
VYKILLEPWGLGVSLANLGPFKLVWSAIDDHVRGAWRPFPLVEKLLSGGDIKVRD